MMALNLALVTLILGFAFLQIFLISLPMCSPSRSQSVQIINSSAPLASLIRLSSIVLLPVGIFSSIGASNRANGSQEFHARKFDSKSCSMTCPATDVTVYWERVCG